MPLVKQTLHGVWSPQFRNRRDIDVYLPESYGGTRRYPVVYMQDGQNLSDPAQAFAGTWHLDDVLRRLASRGIEPIVVGIHNTRERLAEYSPFPDPKHGGGHADSYLAFLIDTLKPRIDRSFRTERSRSRTAIFGSSMGGLLSLYAWFRHPDVFGIAGAMSPSLWYGRKDLFEYLDAAAAKGFRLYADVGTAEGVTTLRDARRLRALVRLKGAQPRLMYREDRGGRHEEAAWSRRLEDALRFLLTPSLAAARPRAPGDPRSRRT